MKKPNQTKPKFKLTIACSLVISSLCFQNVNAQTTNSFSYTGFLQTWIVPCGVTQATITAVGAAGGGANQGTIVSGGHGAQVAGTIAVTPGDTIDIIVGGLGGTYWGGGGGGGTFVWDATSKTLLVIGGGGGGAGYNGGIGGDGQTNTATLNQPTTDIGGPFAATAGGAGGNGGSVSSSYCYMGSAGAGWNSNGADAVSACAGTETGGKSPANGAAGGCCGTYSANGGYGGGGGGNCSGSGGGGYNGGGGGYGNMPCNGGGGGGSFCSGTIYGTPIAANTGNGSATISYSYAVLSSAAGGNFTICSGNSGNLSGIAFNGTGPYTYNWLPGNLSGSSQIVNPTTTTTYTVTATDAIGCKTTATQVVTVNTVPTVSITGKTAVCAGTIDSLIANVTGNSPFTYSWNTTGTNDTITVSSTNAYNVTVSDVNGCKNTASMNVTVNPLPVSNITTIGATTFCQGDSVQFIVSGDSTDIFSWSNGASSQYIYAKNTGNYNVTITNSSGCSITSLTKSVTANPLPTVTVSGKTAICAGTMDTLSANVIGNSPFIYNWSTSSTNDSIEVSSANTYSVTVSDVNGCKNTATVSVIVNSLPTVTVSGKAAICAGTIDTLTANATGNSPFSYSWNTSGTNDTITVSSANTYSVTVSDANGCKNSATASVMVNPLPTITITGNDSASIGHPDVLTATGGGSYLWTTGSTNDTTIVSPTTATVYTVKITDSIGCSAIDSFKVSIKVITTGIVTLTESNGTNLYPNPASTLLNLSFMMQGLSTNATINVLDITGKSLLQTESEISNGKTLPINISTLSAGIYFVRITTEKNTQTIKFVKTDR